MFKKEDDFLPSILLKSKLKQDNFDKFKLINPRLRAAFTEGYGIVFGGSMQILDWKHFEVNILINKPNDEPTTVTIAVFIPSFSVPKLLNDLFEIDISNVPVLGNATVRNLAFSMSTNNVETPLTVLDIGSEYSFDIPYREGLKVSVTNAVSVCHSKFSRLHKTLLVTKSHAFSRFRSKSRLDQSMCQHQYASLQLWLLFRYQGTTILP